MVFGEPNSRPNSHSVVPRAEVFAALGDETRLALVARLSDGQPHSIAQLTMSSRLTRQAITKHLRVLEGVGIVRCSKRGRESVFELDPEPIAGMQEFLESVSAAWDRALTRLKFQVESDAARPPGPGRRIQMTPEEEILTAAYKHFNERNLKAVLKLMHEDVDWENGATGERIPGRAALREYWSQQWKTIDPHVEAVGIRKEPDGRFMVAVHQVVKELDGRPILDRVVEHVYTLDGGLIRKMEIRNRR